MSEMSEQFVVVIVSEQARSIEFHEIFEGKVDVKFFYLSVQSVATLARDLDDVSCQLTPNL
jgi:DNA repair protein RadC